MTTTPFQTPSETTLERGSQAAVAAFVATYGPPERVAFYADARDRGRWHANLTAGCMVRSIRLAAQSREAAIEEVNL